MTDPFIHAKKIVLKLTRAGHVAYFAGGWVRDFVMGHPCEDIDIATSASPSQIMDLFPQTILVGLAFGVVIVVIEGYQFEVASFRKDLAYVDGRRPEAIEMSTPQEDAKRRDFTINGMFYDPIEEKIHDFVYGQEDIQRRLIRSIGDPHERFFEDRLRMLRAFRFAARFDFSIDLETCEAIREHVDTFFPAVAMERVWQEFNKMVAYPRFDQALIEMHRIGLLEVIFPEIAGMHIKEMRQKVNHFSRFPSGCPTILYLMEILLFLPLTKKIEITKRLKGSNKDCEWVEFIEALHNAVIDERMSGLFDRHRWATLFSNSDWQVGMGVLTARYQSDERPLFFQHYVDRFKELEPHIERMRRGKPVVTAALLFEEGIGAGKRMGILLKEAEKIAVNQNLSEPRDVLSKLSHHFLWSKEMA
ncbi:MAG: CCA tRNA nucleotidyltransferase [Parachlamydiaceae bacterium]